MLDTQIYDYTDIFINYSKYCLGYHYSANLFQINNKQ